MNAAHDLEGRARAGLRQTARERDAALSQAHRDKVAELKAQIAGLAKKKRTGMHQIAARCRLARSRLAVARKTMAEELAEARQAAQNRCTLRKHKIRALTVSAVEKKKAELDAERAMWRDIRLAEGRIKAKGTRRTKAEASAESDDQVRHNIPAELVPAFNRVRRTIRAREGMSRTEAFLHWAEENAAEVYAVEAQEADEATAKLVAELRRLEREHHAARPPVRARSRAASLAEAVPF